MLLHPPPPTCGGWRSTTRARVRGEDVELFLFDDAGSRFPPRAMTVEPGLCAWEVAGDDFPFGPGDVERSMRTREGWQSLMFVDPEPHVLLAIMRYELEHVLQHRQNPNLLLAAWALGQGLETSVDPSSLGFRALYAAIATERAADAAHPPARWRASSQPG